MAKVGCDIRVNAACHLAFSQSVPPGYTKSRWAEEIFEVLLLNTQDPRHPRLRERVGPSTELPIPLEATWGPYQISFRIAPQLMDLCDKAAEAAGQDTRPWMRNVLYRASLLSDWQTEGNKDAENTDS